MEYAFYQTYQINKVFKYAQQTDNINPADKTEQFNFLKKHFMFYFP